MFKASKKTQYGLRAMVCLAKDYKKKDLTKIKDVSKIENIPFEFLGKIFTQLEKSGLAKGRKGINGGYALAKNPSKITVKDIFNALESTTIVDCRFCGMKKKCASKNVWSKIDLSIEKTLKSIKLSSLIK